MASTSPWSGTALTVLCVCGVGYGWLSCGLIGDGSYCLFDAVTVGPYKEVGHERAVPNLLAQVPLSIAIAVGVTDLHWLARLQSLGWFALLAHPLFPRDGGISRGRPAFHGLGSPGVAHHRSVRGQGLLRVGVSRSLGLLKESGFRSCFARSAGRRGWRD
jgi:hypothetical protein